MTFSLLPFPPQLYYFKDKVVCVYVSLLQVIQIQIMGHERKHTPSSPTHIRSVRPPITFYIGAKLLTQISPLPRNNEKKKIGIRFLKEFLHVVVCNLCDSSSKLYFKNNLPFQICLQD